MPTTLLIRLDGPLQSWGVASRYARRETLDHPSKSGVIGICAAALGRRRGESIADLAALRFGVLVVDQGRVIEDYHTVSNTIRSSRAHRVDLSPEAVMRPWSVAELKRAPRVPRAGDVDGAAKHTELTWRLYLADAMFVAGLEGPPGLLGEIRDRLERPVFPLALGRASCLPAAPLAFTEREDGGVLGIPLRDALQAAAAGLPELLAGRHRDERERLRRARAVRMIVECDPADATIRTQDQPTEFAFSTRRFTTRHSRSLPVGLPDA